MGGIGSGPPKPVDLDNPGVQNMILRLYKGGDNLDEIADIIKCSRSFLKDYCKTNEKFQMKLNHAYAVKKFNFIKRAEERAIPKDPNKPHDSALARFFLERKYGMKPVQNPTNAIQINQSGEGGATIQVVFHEAPPQLVEAESGSSD